jgi:hypothetical protein
MCSFYFIFLPLDPNPDPQSYWIPIQYLRIRIHNPAIFLNFDEKPTDKHLAGLISDISTNLFVSNIQ